MAKVEYVRCPRCELNYINKKDKLCKVCQMELQNRGTNSSLDSEDLELGVCPVCKTNYISEDEIMCAVCLREKEDNDDLANSFEDKENWRMYVEHDDEDNDDELDDMSSLSGADDDMLSEDLGFGFDEEFDGDEEFDEEFDDLDEEFDDDDESFDDEDFDDDDDED